MIVLTALLLSDGRLYEAAESLRTPTWRKFFTITLPGAKYGLVSAAMVVFSYTVSDFGIPKVIGGSFNVLAVDIYKQVVGQQNFNKGAVVSFVLLVPVLVAFVVDWSMQGKLQAQFSARAVPYTPKPRRGFDAAMFVFCLVVSLLLLSVLGMAVWTSLIKFWPYDLSLSFNHYTYGLIDGGVFDAYLNSLRMALAAAVTGTIVVFAIGYLLEKTRGAYGIKAAVRLLAAIPMGVPGMVLGLGYILFFNHPDNPLNFLYGTLTILVISTIVHYYTSSHLTAVTALKAMDAEFEAVSASLKVPFYKTFHRVTVPVCLPAILDIGRYLFVNAMVDDLGGGVHLRAGHPAGVDRRAGPRRRRRHRPGGGDGHADRRELHDRLPALRAGHPRAAHAHAGVAPPGGRGLTPTGAHYPSTGTHHESLLPRSHPADAGPAHHVAGDQDGDAARLGLLGCIVQRRHRRGAAEAPRHRPRRRDARLRADAGQRHVLGRGGGQHAGAPRRPRAGADQRRLRHATGEARRG